MKRARWSGPPCPPVKRRPETAAPLTPAIFHLSLYPEVNARWYETSHEGEEDRQSPSSRLGLINAGRYFLLGLENGAVARGLMPLSAYLSPSSFMGMPQQTKTPPPASTTFTLLPHTLQRYSCPTTVAMLVLLVGFPWLTPGAEAPERQRWMFNLETLQRLRRQGGDF